MAPKEREIEMKEKQKNLLYYFMWCGWVSLLIVMGMALIIYLIRTFGGK